MLVKMDGVSKSNAEENNENEKETKSNRWRTK